MTDFNAQELPPVQDQAFLELSPKEKNLLQGHPTKNQLQAMFNSYAFRYFIAIVKKQANIHANGFFSGVSIPVGSQESSPREAYFTALVNAHRGMINKQREMWDEAEKREGSDEDVPKQPRPTEGDPFGEPALTAGDGSA